MKIRLVTILLVVFSFSSVTVFSQDTTPADTSYWATGFKGVFTLNQTSFSNWQSGGDNSVALNSIIRLFANYNRDRISLANSLDMSYGFSDTKSQGFRKTDDNLLFVSSFGYKINRGESKLFWTSSVIFNSQFDDGYNYPNDSVAISGWMAPGYLTVNTGLQYKKGDYLSLIYSPVAGKWTFVQDDALAASGAYGVEPGKNVRTELGTTITLAFNKELVKNITYDTKLGLFTNYQENFGNIDVNWNNIFLLKINDWLSSTLVLHFIYDDDINIARVDDNGDPTGQVGPALQFRQAFGLGLTIDL
jgi:hypothetical protein